MEAVLAQAVAARDVLVDRVGADVLGDGGVELAVEAGDVAGAWQRLHTELRDAEAVCVVKRGQVVEGLEVVVRAVGYGLRLGVIPAVDDAMAHDAHVVLASDLGQVAVCNESVEQEVEGIALPVHLLVYIVVLGDSVATPYVLELRGRRRQAAHLALGDLHGRLPRLGPVYRDLDRRGAGVDGEDEFRHSVLANQAVFANDKRWQRGVLEAALREWRRDDRRLITPLDLAVSPQAGGDLLEELEIRYQVSGRLCRGVMMIRREEGSGDRRWTDRPSSPAYTNHCA